MKSINKFLVVMLCFVLFTTMAFALSACIEKELKIAKIEVSGPSETAVGEFDYNDYTVKVIFDDGSTKDIKLNKDLLSASDRELLDTPGTHTITVQYNDVTCTFTVTIKGDGESQDKGIRSIAISGPNEIISGNIDYNDFSLVITYEDDSTTAIELREEFILEEDRAKLNTVGSHSISITYNGTTTTWNITVKENESTGDNIFEGVTFDDATYTYDGREKSIEVNGVPDGATVKYNVSNSYTNAGVYPIEATISKEGYKTLVLTATLTINKATYDMSGVEFDDKTVVYNGKVQRIEISGSLPQGVTVSYDNNENINVGTYEVVAKFTGDSDNYNVISDKTAQLIINKATYDMSGVKFVDKTVVYNGEVQKIEISGSLPQGVTVTYENNDKTDVGTYEVIAKFTGDSNNYEAIADMTATLTINKATYDMSSVEFVDKTVVYNGEVQRIEISGTLPQGVTVSYDNNENINVGTYTVTAKFTGDSNNYEAIADMTATLTINKAIYDMSGVKFVDKTVVYNGEVQRIEISGTLPQGVTVSYENNENINVGTYEVVAKFTGDSNNYETIADMTATLTIKEAKETEGLIFEKTNNDTEYSVVGYEGSESDVVILATHEGLPVTCIGERAFLFCSGLESITIPDSVTSIGWYAFYGCSGLTSIMIPDSVTSIGNSAFSGCSGLTSIAIPDSVTSIGNSAFLGCSGLTSITVAEGNSKYHSQDNCIIETASKTLIAGCKTSIIPDDGSVTSIGENAFDGCSGLTSIRIPDSVTSIGSSAFEDCSGLESITIPDSVTSIGWYAFYGCSGLTSIMIPDSVTSIGNWAFYGCSGLTSITIGNGVTSIGDDAFHNCSSLTVINYNAVSAADLSSISTVFYNAGKNADGITVVFGESVEKIPAYLFYVSSSSYSPKVTSLSLGSNVTSIGAYAFSGCSLLTSITIPDGVTSIGDGSFYNCSGLTSIAIPNSVTSIGEYAFSGCTGLTSVTIPNNVTSIGNQAFYGCSGLTSITIPDSVTSIGSSAFYNCSGLTSITIPDSVTYIGAYAFYGCSGLTSITIPESVKSIGYGAFSSCTGLTSITIPFVGEKADGTGATYFEYIFGEEAESVREVIITDAISIGYDAFYNCSGLISITIPDSVVSICNNAFYGCSGLTSVTIGNGVTSIGYSAFEGCSGLTSITIPDSVTSIGQYAFDGCTNLTSITIPFVGAKLDGTGDTNFDYIFRMVPISLREVIITGGTSIGERAFYNCKGLTSITIPDSVTSIEGHAFYGCSGLTSITIPDSVTSIGDWAFAYCSGLTSITIPDSVTSIGDGAFEGCSGLTSITIPDSVTSIGRNAFFGCSGLTSITIPDSVTSIGSGAFYGCSGLKEVHIRDIAAWCGIEFSGSISNPLYYAHNLYINGKLVTELEIPDSVTGIGSYAFYGCSRLTSITIPDSVTSIGDSAFEDCSGLTIYCEVSSKPNAWNSNWNYSNCPVVWDCNNNEIADDGYIYVITDGIKYGLKDGEAYIAEQSRAISGNVVIKNSILYKGGEYVVTSIGYSAFYGCSGLTSIMIPDSVTSIGNSAFSGCSGLTSIAIPDSVTSIGNSAFSGCSGLTSITVAEGNSKYHSQDNCIIETALKTLIAGCKTSIIPDDGSVTSIGRSAFYGCSGLTSITIPDSVTNIGSYAFYNCSGLTSITIPDSVKSIGDYAFYNCSGLTSITIPDRVTSIGSRAFLDCSGLTSITIPDSVTSIGSYAFSGCSNLTNVIFNNTQGWRYSTSPFATSGTSISSSDLEDPVIAAKYLTTTYVNYYWKRS